MELTLDKLLLGKATQIKGKEFESTSDYITPFIDIMKKYTSDFMANAELAKQISISKIDGVKEDLVYNKVLVQAILPGEYVREGYKQVVAFTYALDSRKPVAKIYSGAYDTSTGNLIAFDPTRLNINNLNEPINYQFAENVIKLTNDIGVKINNLEKTSYTEQEFINLLGLLSVRAIDANWVTEGGTVKLSESDPLTVYKNLFKNEESPYYTLNGVIDGLSVYNAFLQLITDDKKDIVNRFEKTLLVNQVMGL